MILGDVDVEHQLCSRHGFTPNRAAWVPNECRLSRARDNRHTTAMQLLQAGVDRSVIALWLGHESVETTQEYLEADLAMKEATVAKTAPLKARVGRFKPEDQLLAFLVGL